MKPKAGCRGSGNIQDFERAGYAVIQSDSRDSEGIGGHAGGYYFVRIDFIHEDRRAWARKDKNPWVLVLYFEAFIEESFCEF